MTARDITREVLLEALGSSATPFVPVPFVDDWIVARLLRRIAKKVLVRQGIEASQDMRKHLVDGFVGAGETPLAERAAVGAVRFVVRKVAIVLDVKKSHDVFGEAIAFALALDAAIARGAIHSMPARDAGAMLHRAVVSVGSAAVETLAGAIRGSFERERDAAGRSSSQTRAARITDAVGKQIDEAATRLASAVDQELASRRR